MSHLGIDGYVDLTRQTLENADAFRAGVAEIDGIRVLGDSRFHLVAMVASDPSFEPKIDMFALGDALLAKGWFHDRQGPPDSLHSTISNSNTGVIDDYLGDLDDMRGRRGRHPHRRPQHELRHAGVTVCARARRRGTRGGRGATVRAVPPVDEPRTP